MLVFDTDPDTASVLAEHLPHNDAEVLFASTVEGARVLLAESPAAIIVCNPSIAGKASWRFCSQLGEHASRTGMPMVAVKRAEDSPVDVEMYLLGFDVVLGPPVQRNELVALVRSQLRKVAQQRRSALHDPVTGRPGTSLFQEAYQRAASLAAREREPVSIVLLHVDDLDRLRLDAGAEGADATLRTIADAAADTLRQSDLLARGSGDVFLMLLPNTNAAGAARVVEKIHDRLERRQLLGGEAGVVPTLSAGIAGATPQLAFEEVVEAAVRELRPLRGAIESALAASDSPAPARAHRIMLAEDDALTASIIRHRLERLGHEVMHVPDGGAVMRLAPESDISLLILDVKLPYVDGFEALRRLRSMRAMRNLPIMMVTSMGNEEDVAHGFELGADDYLVKPFSPIELQARIQRLLR